MVRHTKKKPRNGATRQGSFAYQTLEPRQLLAADVIITEFLASNDTVLADDNGNFSDYIELYNAGDETADLTGFSLTDDPNQPDKFTFSAGTLAAGEYLVVFAADDTNPTTGTDIYTGFGLSAGGEFVGLYDAAGSLRSSFGENGTDFPPQTTDVTYGLAFEPLPIVIPDILLGSGSGQGNGSFEDITGGTPNFGSNRIGTNGNNGFTASIPGWTVTHQSGGLVGWDDLSPASDGSEYGFVNANAQAVFVSDARFHNLSAGDTLDLSFDTINNVVGESVIFRVTLLFSNGDSAFFQRTHTETDGSYSVEAFRHTVTENQANSSSLSVRIELDNRFNTQQDQPRFDNVQLIRTDASFVPTVLEDFDTVVAPALPAGWVSSTNSTNNFQTGATFADAGVNGVSVAGVEGSSNATLTSPPITVTARNATIRFRHAYQIESGFDGAVLELAIGNGQFQDIIDSGGAFRQGGYDRVLISSQLAGREGWSGTSGGFGTTIVELPTTSHGSDVRLRWRFSSDASVRSGNWSIDTIEQIELIDNSGGADLPREPRTGVFLATPTPGMRNSDRRIGGVTFSQSSQIFLTPFALTLTSAIPNETIRFTLDGSVPTQSSTLYTGPISISVSTEVRARAYSLDGLAGAVFGETYELLTAGLNSFTSNLPILVLDNYGAGNPLTRTFNTTFTALYEPDATTGLTSLTSSATLTSRAATHRRGSSSFTLGKNNFRLEFRDQTDEDQNVSILGMPSESDYILNTFARFDRAAVRNPVAFDTNRQAGAQAKTISMGFYTKTT